MFWYFRLRDGVKVRLFFVFFSTGISILKGCLIPETGMEIVKSNLSGKDLPPWLRKSENCIIVEFLFFPGIIYGSIELVVFAGA
ncbi:hypothetical protein D3C74_420920 [compost metagenome]